MRLHLSFRFSRVLALVMLLAACSETTGPVAGSFDVTPTGEGLAVSNYTERAVYLRAIESGRTPLDDWTPCVSAQCPSQAAGEKRVLPWSSVIGYGPDKKEFVVYWWHADTLPDRTLRPGPVNRVIVTR